MIARTLLLLSVLFAPCVFGADVAIIGLFPGKAVVQINSGAPRTLSVGQKTPEGVSLIAVERDAATLDIDGTRRVVKLGQQHAVPQSAALPAVVLFADDRGQFFAEGQINERPVRFVVDTGASLVTISAADAERLGIDFRKGAAAFVKTANGTANAWRIRLDSVRVGNIRLDNIDAAVIQNQDMPVLLGMSFLNRMDLRREGQNLTLTKRY